MERCLQAQGKLSCMHDHHTASKRGPRDMDMDSRRLDYDGLINNTSVNYQADIEYNDSSVLQYNEKVYFCQSCGEVRMRVVCVKRDGCKHCLVE